MQCDLGKTDSCSCRLHELFNSFCLVFQCRKVLQLASAMFVYSKIMFDWVWCIISCTLVDEWNPLMCVCSLHTRKTKHWEMYHFKSLHVWRLTRVQHLIRFEESDVDRFPPPVYDLRYFKLHPLPWPSSLYICWTCLLLRLLQMIWAAWAIGWWNRHFTSLLHVLCNRQKWDDGTFAIVMNPSVRRTVTQLHVFVAWVTTFINIKSLWAAFSHSTWKQHQPEYD